MGEKTGIEWCDSTCNPLVGCQHAGAGCSHCYAERQAARGMCQAHAAVTTGGRWNGTLAYQIGQVDLLHRLARSKGQQRRIFVGSMTDFGYVEESASRPDRLGLENYVVSECLRKTWDAVAAVGAAGHTVIFLTKRPVPLAHWVRRELDRTGLTEPPAWLWALVSVWDQESADRLVPELQGVPAGLLGVSCEPLISRVDLPYAAFNGADSLNAMAGISWVICGAETGPGARPLDPAWAMQVRDQCVKADVAFFYKRGSDRSRLLDGQKWEQFPEVKP